MWQNRIETTTPGLVSPKPGVADESTLLLEKTGAVEFLFDLLVALQVSYVPALSRHGIGIDRSMAAQPCYEGAGGVGVAP